MKILEKSSHTVVLKIVHFCPHLPLHLPPVKLKKHKYFLFCRRRVHVQIVHEIVHFLPADFEPKK